MLLLTAGAFTDHVTWRFVAFLSPSSICRRLTLSATAFVSGLTWCAPSDFSCASPSGADSPPISQPFGVITIVTVLFIVSLNRCSRHEEHELMYLFVTPQLGPQPPPPMREEVALYTEAKLRRWTFGSLAPSRQSILFRLASLDWWGTALMLATITCLLLPLQWGGNK